MQTMPRQTIRENSPLLSIFDIYGNRLEALRPDQRIDTAIALALSRRYAWPEILFLRFKDHCIPNELLAHLMELTDKETLTLGSLLNCIDRTNGNPDILPE